MNNKNLKIFPKITATEKSKGKSELYLPMTLLFFISFGYFYWFGNGIFFYQENRTLFIYSYEYFQKFIRRPGGLLEYAGIFLTQGYYNNLYGALIISLLLVAFYVVLIKIIKRLSSDGSFSSLIILLPSCLLLLSQTYYEHLMHYSLGFLLIVLWFYISIISEDKHLRFIYLILFPLFYYLTGSFALIYTGLYIMYNVINEKGIYWYLFPSFLIIIFILTFIVFKEIIFLQPLSQLLKFPVLVSDLTQISVYFSLLCIYIILFPLILKGLSSLIVNRKFAIVIPVITISIALPGTVFLINNNYDHDFVKLMQIEKSVYNQNWDAIIKQNENSPIANLTGQYYYNLALAEKGQLCDRLFFGSQNFGAKSLILPHEIGYINKSVYFYYTVGLIREVHHLAYESMVIYGYQPENIKLLIKTELINGNFKIAERHINILQKTLHYRSWAQKYKKMLNNPVMIISDPELGQKIRLLPRIDFFISRNDMQNLNLFLLGNPDNKKAFEYMIARLLLEKDFKEVVYQVKKMKDMGYTSIPRHIEEAIVLFISLNYELPYLGELTVTPETELRFTQYGTKLDINNNRNKSLLKNVKRNEEEKTFWYYFQLK